MKFSNDNQRKAAFANINKFAHGRLAPNIERPIFTTQRDRASLAEAFRYEPIIIEGQTGSNLVTVPGSPVMEPYVSYETKEDFGPSEVLRAKGLNTIILAGEDYKGVKTGRGELVDITSLERKLGRPVYSEAPKKKKGIKSQFGYEIEPGYDACVEVEVEK